MSLATVDHSGVAKFVGLRTGTTFHAPFSCLGTERDGPVIAGAVFNCWSPNDVQLSIAAEPGALTRHFLRRVGERVTVVLGCTRATIETEQPHVIDIALRLGGKIEAIKRNAYGKGRDGTVIGILKDEWFLRLQIETKGGEN